MRATGTYYDRNRESRLAYAKAYRESMTDDEKWTARTKRRLRYRNDEKYREQVKTQVREYQRNKKCLTIN